MELAGVPPPTMDWEASNLPQAWEKFQNVLELIFKGPLKNKSEEEHITYLLLWVGEKGRDVHKSWTDITGEEAKKIKTFYDRFKAHVQPKLNPIFARFKFYNEVQSSDAIESFVTRLRLSARDCSFNDTDDMIRDRIVIGTNSQRVREKLINIGADLTLDKAVQVAQSYEYAQEQLKSMSDNVHMIRRTNKSKQNSPRSASKMTSDQSTATTAARSKQHRPCGNCAGQHLPGQCPARNKKCMKCGKLNHFAKACRSNKKAVHEINKHSRNSEVTDMPDHYGSDPSYDFFVDSVSSNPKSNQAFVLVQLGPKNREISFKIDTGSQVNIIPNTYYRSLGVKGPLIRTASQLSAYNGEALNVLGTVVLDCHYAGRKIKPLFYVVETNSPPLLGLKSSIDLGVIKLVCTVNRTDTLNLSPTRVLDAESVKREFNDVF